MGKVWWTSHSASQQRILQPVISTAHRLMNLHKSDSQCIKPYIKGHAWGSWKERHKGSNKGVRASSWGSSRNLRFPHQSWQWMRGRTIVVSGPFSMALSLFQSSGCRQSRFWHRLDLPSAPDTRYWRRKGQGDGEANGSSGNPQRDSHCHTNHLY